MFNTSINIIYITFTSQNLNILFCINFIRKILKIIIDQIYSKTSFMSVVTNHLWINLTNIKILAKLVDEFHSLSRRFTDFPSTYPVHLTQSLDPKPPTFHYTQPHTILTKLKFLSLQCTRRSSSTPTRATRRRRPTLAPTTMAPRVTVHTTTESPSSSSSSIIIIMAKRTSPASRQHHHHHHLRSSSPSRASPLARQPHDHHPLARAVDVLDRLLSLAVRWRSGIPYI